jgi:hypothetical protein
VVVRVKVLNISKVVFEMRLWMKDGVVRVPTRRMGNSKGEMYKES